MATDGTTGRDWDDAAWFPVDVDVPRQALHLLRVDAATLAGSAFLDNRLDLDWAAAERVAFAEARRHVPARRPVSWLWHTSFCGSTLLARAIGIAPRVTALREPLALRRMSDARAAGLDIGEAAQLACALLSRPLHDGARVLLKPTHAALNVAVDLVGAVATDRSIVLTSSLEDFLVSNLKKSPETQAKAVTLAERALAAGSFRARLAAEAFNPPDLVSATALQWAAQQELVVDLVAGAASPVRVFDAADMFRDLATVAIDAARWLQLDLGEAEIRRSCAEVGGRHAKSTGTPYDSRIREREKALVLARDGDRIRRARDWAARHVLPVMRPAGHLA